jgi:hypothetical protein
MAARSASLWTALDATPRRGEEDSIDLYPDLLPKAEYGRPASAHIVYRY